MSNRAVQVAKFARHGVVFGGILLGLLFIVFGLASESGFALVVGVVFLAGGLYQQYAAGE